MFLETLTAQRMWTCSSVKRQQDMDLKSAFAPTVPRQPFFRLLLGDPKQSPGGVAFFFPRVRTPCGHGVQVIVEGREEQSDGGEKNKDPKTNPKPNTPSPRPKLHHLVVFPLHWVKHVKRKLMAINGPEFSKEKDGSAGLWSGKVS